MPTPATDRRLPRSDRDGSAGGHLQTAPLRRDLRVQSLRSIGVTLTAQLAQTTIRMLGVVVLARILSPADFGLVAMAAAFTGLFTLIHETGLAIPTVQRETLEQSVASTFFWINVGISVLLALVAAVIAPLLAWLYGDSRLVLVTLAFAATSLVAGVGTQHRALMRRQMRFRALSVLLVGSDLVGVLTAVAVASSGGGYWALVALPASTVSAKTILTWILCPWRPDRPTRERAALEMLAMGMRTGGSGFANYSYRHVDDVLIGTAFGAAALGIYSKAYELLMLPLRQLTAPVNQVILPVLCRVTQDSTRFRRTYVRALRETATLTLPLVMLTAVAAEDLVFLLLGPEWDQVATIFRALLPAAVVGCTNAATAWAFLPFGRADRQLRCVLFSGPPLIAGFLVGMQWGPVGVALGYSIALSLIRIPQLLYAYETTPVGLGDFVRAVWRPAVASALASVSAFLLGLVLLTDSAPLLRFAVTGAAFGALYLAGLRFLPGGREWLTETISLARGLLRRPAQHFA